MLLLCMAPVSLELSSAFATEEVAVTEINWIACSRIFGLTFWRVGKTPASIPTSAFGTCNDKSTVFLNWGKTHLPLSNKCNVNHFVHKVSCQIL